eukprot:1361254-Alexandrium_andersonii.AAC.1
MQGTTFCGVVRQARIHRPLQKGIENGAICQRQRSLCALLNGGRRLTCDGDRAGPRAKTQYVMPRDCCD